MAGPKKRPDSSPMEGPEKPRNFRSERGNVAKKKTLILSEFQKKLACVLESLELLGSRGGPLLKTRDFKA